MAVSDKAFRDVVRDREVHFSSTMLKVEDRLTAASRETFQQSWHVPPNAHVTIEGTQALVSYPDGVLMVISQLEPMDDMKVIVGQNEPLMGWTALRGEQIPTAVLVSTVTGESARFVTEFRLESSNAEPRYSGS